MLTERHLFQLGLDIRDFEKHSSSENRGVFFSEILRRCNDIKALADTHSQTDIKEMIGNAEMVVELIRRKKMDPTAEAIQLLHRTIQTILQITSNQSPGNEAGQGMILELREHYNQIKSRHTSL